MARIGVGKTGVRAGSGEFTGHGSAESTKRTVPKIQLVLTDAAQDIVASDEWREKSKNPHASKTEACGTLKTSSGASSARHPPPPIVMPREGC